MGPNPPLRSYIPRLSHAYPLIPSIFPCLLLALATTGYRREQVRGVYWCVYCWIGSIASYAYLFFFFNLRDALQ